MDALEQALWARNNLQQLIHHSDRSRQYLSIRYTERLAEARISALVVTSGDSYDNALAETIIGLYKTEVIHHRGRLGRVVMLLNMQRWNAWIGLTIASYLSHRKYYPLEREKEYYQLEESRKASCVN